MLLYAGKRLVQAVPMLFFLSIVVFLLLELSPGDAAQAILARGSGGGGNAEDVERLREQLGLNEPIFQRYISWLWDALHLDFGRSYRTGREVSEVLRDAVPPTLLLVSVSLVITATGGLVLGLIAGVWPRSIASKIINLFIVLMYSTPAFLIAIFLILIFSVRLGWLPSTGMTTPGEDVSIQQLATHVIMPAVALGVSHHMGALIRIVEAAVTENRDAPFIEAARARGVGEMTILWTYTARSAMVPFVAQLGSLTGALVAGAYAIEVIFSWPGVGRVALDAANARDYPILLAVIMVSGVAVIIGNVVADVLVALLDPRVRLEGERRATPAGELPELAAMETGAV